MKVVVRNRESSFRENLRDVEGYFALNSSLLEGRSRRDRAVSIQAFFVYLKAVAMQSSMLQIKHTSNIHNSSTSPRRRRACTTTLAVWITLAACLSLIARPARKIANFLTGTVRCSERTAEPKFKSRRLVRASLSPHLQKCPDGWVCQPGYATS